ncbi:hypothetical protein D3C86_1832700 [compost metagenome]
MSFTLQNLHYNLAVRLLSDRYGIQARGGCSCAGPYGHYLLGLDRKQSEQIVQDLHAGDQSSKPGWVRLSLHPIMTDAEIDRMVAAVQSLTESGMEWSSDYSYTAATNSWVHRSGQTETEAAVRSLFSV